MPAGVAGELYIAGAGLARGLSASGGADGGAVCCRPVWPAGSRMYRTGDLARWRADGVLEFLGRADAQVKLRGFRIEPGEIEAALLRHGAVAQAAVIAREDACGGEAAHWLCGGCAAVGRAGSARGGSGLRAHVAGPLPDYMVPSGFVVLDAASAHAERQARPPRAAGAGSAGLCGRRTRRRARRRRRSCAGCLPRCWGCGRVGIDDNFFELGGHSLLATRLISRIRASLDVEISIRGLFEAPTVAGLAQQLGRGAGGRAAAAARMRGRLRSRCPMRNAGCGSCTAGGMGQRAAYIIPVAVRLEGALDVGALERALCDVVERHESLRTMFPERDGVARQEILEARAARPRLEVGAVR